MELRKLKEELLQVSNGLMMMSETDAAFEFVAFQVPDNKYFEAGMVACWDGQPQDTQVDTLTLDSFLNRVMHPHADAGVVAQRLADRYRQLLTRLCELLEEPKAYKVGKVRMPVYLIGRTNNGYYAGLKTLVVET